MRNEKKWYFRDWLLLLSNAMLNSLPSLSPSKRSSLLRRIPHAKMNKKKQSMQSSTSLFSKKTWVDGSKRRTLNPKSIYNWFVFFTIRIICRLMSSVSWSAGNQAFLLLKLEITKWHTSYLAWWGSAWGQHSWNRKHPHSYDLFWEKIFLWHILSLLSKWRKHFPCTLILRGGRN